MKSATDIQLHIFCDTSEQAFSAIAYLRVYSQEATTTSIIGSKTRVSPRPMSILRLEVQAAVLAARLSNTNRNQHEIKIDSTIFWTDSKTVLCWLRNDARSVKPFISHRVGEILDLSDVIRPGVERVFLAGKIMLNSYCVKDSQSNVSKVFRKKYKSTYRSLNCLVRWLLNEKVLRLTPPLVYPPLIVTRSVSGKSQTLLSY